MESPDDPMAVAERGVRLSRRGNAERLAAGREHERSKCGRET